MMSLYTLLVINVFGGFWSAVFGMMLMMYIILIMGNTSQDTCLTFLYLFLLAMTMGYGLGTLSILMTILIFYLNLMVLPRMINRASQ